MQWTLGEEKLKKFLFHGGIYSVKNGIICPTYPGDGGMAVSLTSAVPFNHTSLSF